MSRGANTTSCPWARDRAPITGQRSVAAYVIVVGIVLASAVACSSNTGHTSSSSSSTARQMAAMVAARPSVGCRKTDTTPPTPGSTTHSLAAKGLTHTYTEQIPRGYTGTKPVPLVVDFHGYAEGAQLQASLSGFQPLADTAGVIVLTPQGEGNPAHWDTTTNGPDVAFFGALLDRTEADLCIDLTRVFVTGYSNGAFLTSVLACVYADRVAAVAPVAGIRDVPGCKPSRPVPVIAFHGSGDQFVEYLGGVGPKAAQLPAPDGSGRTLGQRGATGGNNNIVPGSINQSVPSATAAWAKRNGCAAHPDQRAVAGDVTLISYRCPARTDVELYRVAGGGHAWPGSKISAAIAPVVGRTTFSINATDLMWRFFVAHPLGR